MKKFLIILGFNLLEIFVIFLIGLFLNIEHNNVTMLLFLFFITRMTFKSPLHYKKWYLCGLWSVAIFMSMFLLLKADIFISILSAVFTGYVTCGKGNIEEIFMFKKESKYKLLDDFIQYNYDHSELARYENHLFNTDKLKYRLFILRFRKNCTWDVIEEHTGITDRKRLNSMLDSMYDTLSYNLMLEI